jgi:DNA-binding phage protein
MKVESAPAMIAHALREAGDVERMLRKLLYEAANSILARSRGSFALKGAMKIAKRRGLRKVRVTPARRLAVIMHAMLRGGTVFEA